MRNIAVAAAISLCSALPGQAQPSSHSSTDQRRAQMFYEEGWKDLAAESYDAAVKDFSSAANLDPTMKLAFYGLGRAHMGLKQFPDAIKAYEHSRELFADQVGNSYANVAEADRIRQDDQRQLQTAIGQLSGKNATGNTAQILAMRAALQRNQVKRETLKDANVLEGVPAFVEVALGSAYFRASRLPDAEREYKAALQSDSKAGEAWNNLAALYLVTDRIEEAEKAVVAAEKVGYSVNPGLKADIKKRKSGS